MDYSFFMTQHLLLGEGPFIADDPWSHTHTHIRQDSSGGVIGPSQRPLPDNTQQSQNTDIHVPWGIRTRNPS